MFELVKDNDPILQRRISEFLGETDPEKLGQEMIEFVLSKNGLGLAAPQLGLSHRIFVMCVSGQEYICVNPKIMDHSFQSVKINEGCLSFPMLYLNISRPIDITVSYENENGKQIATELDGMAARCFMHELDHLNGITFDSKVSKLVLNMAKRRQRKILRREKEND